MPSAIPWTSASSAGNQPVYAPAMVRFMVLYQPPTDAEAFEKIADDVHKLAERRPVIRSMIFELEDL